MQLSPEKLTLKANFIFNQIYLTILAATESVTCTIKENKYITLTTVMVSQEILLKLRRRDV